VAHVYLVRHIFFSIFYFCRKKIFNLPYLFTLFEFGDSKNCPTGHVQVNSDVEFSPSYFDILCVFFSSSYAARNPV
jgi:hypothetical protein